MTHVIVVATSGAFRAVFYSSEVAGIGPFSKWLTQRGYHLDVLLGSPDEYARSPDEAERATALTNLYALDCSLASPKGS